MFINELLLWYWFEMMPSNPSAVVLFLILSSSMSWWKPINKWRSTSCFHVSKYTAFLTVTAKHRVCRCDMTPDSRVILILWMEEICRLQEGGEGEDINNGQNNVTRPWKCDSMHTKTILSASSSQMSNLEKVIAFLYSSLLFSLMFLCLSVSYKHTRSHSPMIKD